MNEINSWTKYRLIIDENSSSAKLDFEVNNQNNLVYINLRKIKNIYINKITTDKPSVQGITNWAVERESGSHRTTARFNQGSYTLIVDLITNKPSFNCEVVINVKDFK